VSSGTRRAGFIVGFVTRVTKGGDKKRVLVNCGLAAAIELWKERREFKHIGRNRDPGASQVEGAE